jgi:CubicO group peptidase (beta-lactamase class C family)
MRFGLMILCGMLAALPAWCATAADDLAASPAGPRVHAYIAAFNSLNDGKMRSFLGENIAEEALAERGIDDRIAAYHRIQKNMTRMDLERVQRSDPDNLVIVVKDQTGALSELSIHFQPNKPHKIISILFNRNVQPQLPPAGAPLAEAAVLDPIQQWLRHMAEVDSFSGSVLIARAGMPVLRKGYGWADREHRVLNQPETRFNVGSIGKSFTRIAVEGLITQGILAPSDKLGKYLPDYPNADARQKVTIQHLLDMRSGIPDFFGEEFMNTPRDHIRALRDYLPFFAAKPLLFEPGTAERYSNGGYLVLGLIIEKITGQSYYDYVRSAVFAPADMRSTGFFGSDDIVPDRAIGYTHRWQPVDQDSPELRSNVLTLPGIGSSAGGGYSTVDDLLKFVNALTSGTLKSSEGGGGMGIAGGSPGVNAAIESGVGQQYTIIVLCNWDPPLAEDTAMRLREWVTRIAP